MIFAAKLKSTGNLAAERLTCAPVLAIVRRFDKSGIVRVLKITVTQSGCGSLKFEQAEPLKEEDGQQ
jgi:hypothetical protein